MRSQPAVRVQYKQDSGDVRYAPEVEEQLYRIAQQACENALRHAQASLIQIECRCEPESVTLTVSDDGIGIHDERLLDWDYLLAQRHYGLAGMHERADIIGAQIKLRSKPGGGTEIHVTWEP